MYNEEDLHDHRTVALAARFVQPPYIVKPMTESKFLFSINLKHRMITFPIGKCHADESLLKGLAREMQEELGLDIVDFIEHFSEIKPVVTFTNEYDFTGKNVKVETNVFYIDFPIGEWICVNAQNMEPDKCGGIFVATIGDVQQMCKVLNLKMADCVSALPWYATSIKQKGETND